MLAEKLTEKNGGLIEKAVIEAKLKELVDDNKSIYAVLVSSVDGHAVAWSTNEAISATRLAAMTSSCLALGEQIALEAKQNGCDFVIIQNENGYSSSKRIGPKLVITSFANKSINLGMMLSATRLAAEALEGEITL